jgi:ArsR family transcriptional regulator
MPLPDERFHRIAKALADPQRFALLEAIMNPSADGGGTDPGPEVPCKKLVERFPVSQATISHHLKELSQAELIDIRREGQYAYLSPRPGTLAAYYADLKRRLPAGR